MLKITEKELEDLIATEEDVIKTEILSEVTNYDEIYGDTLHELLSLVYDCSYVDAISENFPDLKRDDLIEIQCAVADGLKERILSW